MAEACLLPLTSERYVQCAGMVPRGHMQGYDGLELYARGHCWMQSVEVRCVHRAICNYSTVLMEIQCSRKMQRLKVAVSSCLTHLL